MIRFEELRLAEPIVRAVASEGYSNPTPIQTKAIPEILAGRDLVGCAQTGTGKTGAFALPILHLLNERSPSFDERTPAPSNRQNRRRDRHANPQKVGGAAGHGASRLPRALILCPTRELAAQIDDSFRSYGRNLRLRHTAVFGGVSQRSQERALNGGVDIIIATPGRLLDLMEQELIDFRAIEHFVLDEADRMLDMGFIHDIRRIVKTLPVERQTLLFSATMPAEIRRLADSILRDPISVRVDPESSTATNISQSVYHVAQRDKPALLEVLLRRGGMGRTLVFTRTKHGADKVVRRLVRAGVRAEAIHGNKSQNARTRALAAFKSNHPPVLIATDIASRGIDVDEVSHVINFDLPDLPEVYVHRIGRTARAGSSGIAISFCDREERSQLRAIERLIRKTIDVNDEPELCVEAAGAESQSKEFDADKRANTTRSRSASGSAATRQTRHALVVAPGRGAAAPEGAAGGHTAKRSSGGPIGGGGRGKKKRRRNHHHAPGSKGGASRTTGR